MNALRLMSVLALLLILLPWRAQAAEADDFVAASRSQQAQLLSQWAAAPQADRLPLLRALTTESLVMDDGKHAFRTDWADYSHWALSPRRRAKPGRSV
ncbi:urea ABC transporter, permease protein UrtB [Klebsiella pneumoniae]|nr:urea ABC transporter, permease protein UrtB [Klebsiella pneumoniae]